MRTFIAFSFVLLAFIAQSQSLNDSLLLYYPMNGNCNDVSGHGFDAAVINASLVSDCYDSVNSAYHFDGVGQYIDWPNDAELHPDLPITIAFRVRFDSNDYLKGFLFDTDYAQNNYSGIHVNLDPGMRISFSFGDGSGSTSPSARRSKTGTTVFQPNVWYFVAGVIREANDMDIYVNCQNDGGTYSGSGGPIAYTGVPGRLGSSDGDMYGPAQFFNGSLDEFKYWHRALTETEILSLCDGFEGEISFPNVFTPNGDSYNPLFKGQGENILEFHISIFNRWGQLVYEGTSFEEGWDGTVNGNECAEGVYYWVADYNLYRNSTEVKEQACGSVTLFR